VPEPAELALVADRQIETSAVDVFSRDGQPGRRCEDMNERLAEGP
jgi:hypothetical protein